MTTIQFATQRSTNTQYYIVDTWDSAFNQWFASHNDGQRWSRIVVLTDEQVWVLYEDRVRTGLAALNRPVLPLVLPPGENSKDFGVLPSLVDVLMQNRVHRRDLLLCVGGGVCCDLGGLLALLYMRGIDLSLIHI